MCPFTITRYNFLFSFIKKVTNAVVNPDKVVVGILVPGTKLFHHLMLVVLKIFVIPLTMISVGRKLAHLKMLNIHWWPPKVYY